MEEVRDPPMTYTDVVDETESSDPTELTQYRVVTRPPPTCTQKEPNCQTRTGISDQSGNTSSDPKALTDARASRTTTPPAKRKTLHEGRPMFTSTSISGGAVSRL